MNKSVLIVFLLVTTSLSSGSTEARSLRETLKKEYERNFAVSVVLTDSDVFTVGFSDFDPNESFNLDNEDIGSRDSVNLRKQVSVITLPFGVNIFEGEDEDKSAMQYQLKGRVYALGLEQDVTIVNEKAPDKSSNQVLGGYMEFASEKQLSDKLALGGGFGYHLMYYNNDYEYRSDALDEYRPLLDGTYFNTDAWAAIGEMNARLKYQENQSWGKWYIWSAPHYFYGTAWGDANDGNVGLGLTINYGSALKGGSLVMFFNQE